LKYSKADTGSIKETALYPSFSKNALKRVASSISSSTTMIERAAEDIKILFIIYYLTLSKVKASFRAIVRIKSIFEIFVSKRMKYNYVVSKRDLL
jgi:hypothetical protein